MERGRAEVVRLDQISGLEGPENDAGFQSNVCFAGASYFFLVFVFTLEDSRYWLNYWHSSSNKGNTSNTLLVVKKLRGKVI